MPSPSGFARFLGPKNLEMTKNWIGSLAFFGASAAGVGLYITDWQAVLQYVPYYGGKFSPCTK